MIFIQKLQPMKKEISNYYGEKYFLWQKKMGEFGGKVETFKFKKHINKTDVVCDFGCGGGYLLKNIRCSKKIGIEINDVARNHAIENGIDAFKFSDDIPENYCDVIISNHALEHTFNPHGELEILHSKLKKNGKIIFIVPNEKKWKWDANDCNKHLYTWCEMTLGNLFAFSGYEVLSVKELVHKWPPYYYYIYEYFGDSFFYFTCKLYGYLCPKLSQVKIVAEKK